MRKAIIVILAIAFVCFGKPAQSRHTIETSDLRLHFGDVDDGFSCVGMENLANGGTEFITYKSDVPGLWRLDFAAIPKEAGKDIERFSLRNNQELAYRKCSFEKLPNGLRFIWKNLDVPNEPHVLDVIVDVTTAADGGTEWRIKVNNRSKRFGVWETYFPCLQQMFEPGTGDAFHPTGNWGGRVYRNSRTPFKVCYPSAYCAVQTMAFMKDGGGIYVGAHDGEAWMKYPTISKEQDCHYVTPAEDMGQPGGAGAPRHPVVVKAFKGDWWEVARIYREWALKQPWTAKGPIATRKDFSPLMKRTAYWLLAVGDPKAVGDTVNGYHSRLKELGASDLPITLHHYGWQQERFDTYYPEQKARETFEKETRRHVANGDVVMPYFNGRLWDTILDSWKTDGINSCCLKFDGKPEFERYGPGHEFGVFCPATAKFHEIFFSKALMFKEKYGTNALYLDQIASAQPHLCFNPKHGHKLGNGAHWVKGYKELLQKICSETGLMLSVENTAEPYMAELDGFLAWLPQEQEDVPFQPAVYGGYTCYFSSKTSLDDDQDSFIAAQNRYFLWGEQLGWFDPAIGYLHKEKFKYLVNLMMLHKELTEFLVEGSLVGEIHPVPLEDTVTVTWNLWKTRQATIPAVESAVWRNFKGDKLLLMLANQTNVTRHADLSQFDAAKYINGAKGMWTAVRQNRAGTAKFRELKDGKFDCGVNLAPHELFIIVISQEKDTELDNAAAEYLFHKLNGVRVECDAVARGLEDSPATLNYTIHGRQLPPAATMLSYGIPLKTQLQLVFPDGETKTIDVQNGSVQKGSHTMTKPFKRGATQTTVTVTDGVHSYNIPITIKQLPKYEIYVKINPIVSGKDVFTLPVTLVNNTASEVRANIVPLLPEGWKSNADSIGQIIVPADGTLVVDSLEFTVPHTEKQANTSMTLKFMDATAKIDVNLRPDRPEIVCAKIDAVEIDGDLKEWNGRQAVKAATVKISKDYKGDADCSGSFQCAYDKERFYFAVDVSDNVHHQDQTGADLWKGDCVQICIRPDSVPNLVAGRDESEIDIAVARSTEGRLMFWKWAGGGQGKEVESAKLAVKRDDAAGKTFYEASIPWKDLGISFEKAQKGLTFSYTVLDNDGDGFRGWIEWTPGVCGTGRNSADFGRLLFN